MDSGVNAALRLFRIVLFVSEKITPFGEINSSSPKLSASCCMRVSNPAFIPKPD